MQAATEIERIVGVENSTPGVPEHAIAGVTPARVAAPGSREEAAELIRLAAAEGWGLAPLGGGTQAALGFPLARLDLLLSTSRLNRVVDYQPDDMTVTVEPGLTLAELERLLAGRGQLLPLNPPLPERATVGGTVAAAAAGPWRAAYGTPRDWVIGCRVVGADGQEVRGGGQVVKNVAGYDLPKLYTGSFGTLGLLTEITFKVLPRPPAAGFCRVACGTPAAVEAFLARLLDSDSQPAAVELAHAPVWERLGAPLPEGCAWGLLLQFIHVPEAVAWQIRHAEQLAAGAGDSSIRTEALPEDGGTALLEALRDLPARHPFTARIGTVSSRAAEIAGTAAALCEHHGAAAEVFGHAATGQVYVCAGEEAPEEVARDLRGVAREAGASCVFTRLPAALTGKLDPWGEIGPELRVMKEIKRVLDPRALFNPGRFVGRI